jgi:hypothetical protein
MIVAKWRLTGVYTIELFEMKHRTEIPNFKMHLKTHKIVKIVEKFTGCFIYVTKNKNGQLYIPDSHINIFKIETSTTECLS